MKKILIYHEGKVIRVVTVHPSFMGIGKRGQVNHDEFKKLALNLEPTADRHEIMDA